MRRERRMKNRLCLTALLLFSMEIPAGAMLSSEWRKVSPGLGNIQRLVPDRRHPGLWYTVNNGTLYRSPDAGQSWRPTGITNVIPDSFNQSEAVSVNPITSEVLVITSKALGDSNPKRLWASNDLGKTFSLRSPLVNVARIFPSFQDPNLLFGFSNGDYGLSISHDGGVRWAELQDLPYKIGENFPGYPEGCSNEFYDFSDLVISPFDEQTIYATGDLYISCPGEQASETVHVVSFNGGKNWSTDSNLIFRFERDAAVADFVIGNDNHALYRLTKQGWRPLANRDIRDITQVPSHTMHLVGREFSFKNNPKFLRSIDGGKTWSPFPTGLADIQHLEFDYDGTWLAGTSGGGMYRRAQGRTSWVSSNQYFQDAEVQDVARASDGSLYILTGGSCNARYVFRSSDAGKTWRKVWFGFPSYCSDEFGRLFINDKDPSVIALAVGHLYISHDSGAHWRQSSIAEKGIVSVAFDSTGKNRIYATGYQAHRSENGGQTFERLPLAFDESATISMRVDPNDNRVLYFLVPYQGVFRSSDGGRTMQMQNSGIEHRTPTDLVPLAARDSFLLLTNDGPLYKTMDGGQHWEKLANRAGEKIFAADGAGIRFYVFNGYNLYFTADAGQTWRNLTADLDQKLERTAITDPRMTPFYLATTTGLFTKSRF